MEILHNRTINAVICFRNLDLKSQYMNFFSPSNVRPKITCIEYNKL